MDAHGTPADVLRWRRTTWDSGALASAPIPVSSYEVVDALAELASPIAPYFRIWRRLSSPGIPPGAQLVQRYAVVGRAPIALSITGGIHFRFVTCQRLILRLLQRSAARAVPPLQDFQPLEVWSAVDGVPYLKAGGGARLVTVGGQTTRGSGCDLSSLGTADIDPHEKDLDVSCSGEAQGPTRFESAGRRTTLIFWQSQRRPMETSACGLFRTA